MRSIKPDNNDYWDTTGIVHGRQRLSDTLDYSLRTWDKLHGNYMSDFNSRTITVKDGGVYLFINSHVIVNSVILIFTWVSGSEVQILKLAENNVNGNSIPTVSLSGDQLTITANGPCRGYLYELSDMSSI